MSKRLHNNEGIYNSNYIQSLERKYCCSSAVLASSGCVVSSGGLGGRVALRIYEGGRRLMYTAAVGAMLLNNMAPAAMADTTVVSAGDISAGLGAGEGSDILVYGTTSNTALSGGRETVYSGGLTVSTVVSPGEQIVSSGGVANYTTINSGGTQRISSGGVANSTTINNGGQIISSGGVANYTTINRGNQYIYSGGEANYTTINDGAYQYISSGGVANSTTLYGEAQQVVSSGGVANSTTINNGGQIISSGGVANYTTVNDFGGQYIYSGSEANSTTLYDVAQQLVFSGGVANYTTIDDEAYQGIGAGEANYTTINRGTQEIVLGGVANYTTINSGRQYISSGGVANSTTINSGGNQYISSGGVANDTYLKSNGNLILRGGSANNLLAEGGLISVENASYLSGYTNMINGTQIVFAESAPDAKLSMENLDANQLNIKMNVNLEDQTGNVLYIEQGFRGNAEIELNNTAASAAPTEGEGIRLVEFGSSGYMEEGAIYLKGGQWDDGGYIYNLFQGGMSSAGMDYDYYLRSTGKYSDLFKTMLNIPLMNVMIARTGMNSLQTRLGDLRDMDNQGKKHGVWVRSYYKDLTVKDLTKTDLGLFGVEAGYDWLFRADEPTKLYAGVMLGYTQAFDIKTAKETGGYDSGSGESPSVGVYATLVDDSRWFVDIAARNFWTKLDMTNYSAAGNALSYEPKRNVITASVEGGKTFLSPLKGGGFFKIEPKAELNYMRASSDSTAVQSGMGDLSYDAGDYLNAKAAILLGYSLKRSNGLLIEPLIELAYRYEFLGKNDVYYGGVQEESDIGGSVGEANIGLNMQLTKDLYWYALGGYEYGSHIKGWSANLGIRLAFGGEKAKEDPKQALAPEQGQTSEQPPAEQQDSPTRFIRIR